MSLRAASSLGKVGLGLDRLAQLALERFFGVRIRYERPEMPTGPLTEPLQRLSASWSVSTVRPSGTRGIPEQTQAGQAVHIRCASSVPLRRTRMRCERESVVVVCQPGFPPSAGSKEGRVVPCRIGLDVHREFAQIAVWRKRCGSSGRTDRTTPEAIRVFADSPLKTDEVAIEATCNTHAIVKLIASRVARVVISNPMKTRAITEAKVKTDRVDAAILAQLLAADYLLAVWMPDEHTQALRRQVARRAHLVRQRTRLKNQLQAILQRNLIPKPPVSDLFGIKGRCWLSNQPLPPDEEFAVEALLRQLDFHGQELRIIDASLGGSRCRAETSRWRCRRRGRRGLSPVRGPRSAGVISWAEPAGPAIRRRAGESRGITKHGRAPASKHAPWVLLTSWGER